MTRDEAIAEALSEMARVYKRDLDASEISLIRWGFCCGTAFQAKHNFDSVAAMFPEKEVPVV